VKIDINATYSVATSSAGVELPGVESLRQLEHWEIRYGVLIYKVAGESQERRVDLAWTDSYEIDWEDPTKAEILPSEDQE
jgi:hypothetical protein